MALTLVQPPAPPAGYIARTLLCTWIRGDRRGLEIELDRAARNSLEESDLDESDRLQLVRDIAARMKTRPDMFASRRADPVLDACVDLLAHLSSLKVI